MVTIPFLCLPSSPWFSTNCSFALHDTYYHSHVSAPTFINVVVVKSLFVFLHALVRYRGCEISDCVIQGLYLDQESVKLLLGKSSHIGSQSDQSFVISGYAKRHMSILNENFLKSFHPLITVPAAVKQAIRRPFSKTHPTTMPVAMMINAKAFKQLWQHLQ